MPGSATSSRDPRRRTRAIVRPSPKLPCVLSDGSEELRAVTSSRYGRQSARRATAVYSVWVCVVAALGGCQSRLDEAAEVAASIRWCGAQQVNDVWMIGVQQYRPPAAEATVFLQACQIGGRCHALGSYRGGVPEIASDGSNVVVTFDAEAEPEVYASAFGERGPQPIRVRLLRNDPAAAAANLRARQAVEGPILAPAVVLDCTGPRPESFSSPGVARG